MKTIGRYITELLLAVPAAGIVAIAIALFLEQVSWTDDPSAAVFLVAFLVGLAVFTPLISIATTDWHNRGILIRITTVLPMSIILPLFPAFIVGSFAYYITRGWLNQGGVGIFVFIAGFTVCALWLARSFTGREAVRRGCGLMALMAFALPVYAIGFAIVVIPNIQGSPSMIAFEAVLSVLVGVPLSIVSAIIWWLLRDTY